MWLLGGTCAASITIPYALPSLTTNATPFVWFEPPGAFRLLWATTCAFDVVVEVELVLDVPTGLPPDDAAALEECLVDPPLLRTMVRITTTMITISAPTTSRIAPPRRELGRSDRRGGRRPRSPEAVLPGPVVRAAPESRSSVYREGSAARAAARDPSGISGSGWLATWPSSEASTRAQARS